MSTVAYPHDGSEVIGAARPVGGRGYLCARGNCGMEIGSHANQDAHNADMHFEDAGIAAAKATADRILNKWNTHPETDPTRTPRGTGPNPRGS